MPNRILSNLNSGAWGCLTGSAFFWAIMPLLVELVHLVEWMFGAPPKFGISVVVAFVLFPASAMALVFSAAGAFALRRTPGPARIVACTSLILMLAYVLGAVIFWTCDYQP